MSLNIIELLNNNLEFFLFIYGLILIFSGISAGITYKISDKKPRIKTFFLIPLALFSFFLGIAQWIQIAIGQNNQTQEVTYLYSILLTSAYISLFIGSLFFIYFILIRYFNCFKISKKIILVTQTGLIVFFILSVITSFYLDNFLCPFRFFFGLLGAMIWGCCFLAVAFEFKKNKENKKNIWEHFVSGILFILFGLSLLFCDQALGKPIFNFLTYENFQNVFTLPIQLVKFVLILALNILLLRLIIFINPERYTDQQKLLNLKIKYIQKLSLVIIIIIILAFPAHNIIKNFFAQTIKNEISIYFLGLAEIFEVADFNQTNFNEDAIGSKINLLKKQFKHGDIYLVNIYTQNNNKLFCLKISAQNTECNNENDRFLYENEVNNFNLDKVKIFLHSDGHTQKANFRTYIPIKNNGDNIAIIALDHSFDYYDKTLFYLEFLAFTLTVIIFVIVLIGIYFVYSKAVAQLKLSDINELLDKKVENRTQQLKKAFVELKSLDELKDEFLNISAHELKTPLTSIIALTEILLLKKQGQLTPKQSKSLKIVNTESNRLLSIIKKILNITRLEAGKMVFNIAKTDLVPIIKDIINSLQPLANKIKVKIIFKKPTKQLFANVDAERFYEIIYNFVSNAIKFSDDNDTITIFATIKNKKITISVKDQGPGMDKEKQKKLFKKFSQLNTGFARNQEGTGLGLYISKKMTEKMKGKIWVESEPGKGADFKVSFPIAKK